MFRTVLMLAALFAAVPAVAQAQTTALFLDSQSGDYIGQGLDYNYTPAQATFEATRNGKSGVTIKVQGATLSDYWYVELAAAGGVPLSVGAYEAATRLPF